MKKKEKRLKIHYILISLVSSKIGMAENHKIIFYNFYYKKFCDFTCNKKFVKYKNKNWNKTVPSMKINSWKIGEKIYFCERHNRLNLYIFWK